MPKVKRRRLKKKRVFLLVVFILLLILGGVYLYHKKNVNYISDAKKFIDNYDNYVGELLFAADTKEINNKKIDLDFDITYKTDKKQSIKFNLSNYNNGEVSYTDYNYDNNRFILVNDEKNYVNFPDVNDDFYEVDKTSLDSNDLKLTIDYILKNNLKINSENVNLFDMKLNKLMVLIPQEKVSQLLGLNHDLSMYIYTYKNKVVGIGYLIDKKEISFINKDNFGGYLYRDNGAEILNIEIDDDDIRGKLYDALSFKGKISKQKLNLDFGNYGEIKYQYKNKTIDVVGNITLDDIDISLDINGKLSDSKMPNYKLKVKDIKSISESDRKEIGSISNKIVLGLDSSRECESEFDTDCILLNK